MRLRVNEVEHFVDMIEETDIQFVYVDDHAGFIGTYYHVWFKSGHDMVEIRINNLDSILFLVTEITKMKKKLRIVECRNSRKY